MQRARQTGRDGFTLMELLVVISIIVILTAMAIPAIQTFMKGQKLEQSGRLIHTAFNDARRRAITTRVRHYLIFYREEEGTPPVYRYYMAVYREDEGYQGEPTALSHTVSPLMMTEPSAATRNGQIADSGIIIFEGKPEPSDANYASYFTARTRPDGTTYHVPNTSSGGGGSAFPWCVFEKDGTIELRDPAKNWPRDKAQSANMGQADIFDVNAMFGTPLPSTTVADIKLQQVGETEKRCFIDIDPNTGRVKFRVLRVDTTTTTTTEG